MYAAVTPEATAKSVAAMESFVATIGQAGHPCPHLPWNARLICKRAYRGCQSCAMSNAKHACLRLC